MVISSVKISYLTASRIKMSGTLSNRRERRNADFLEKIKDKKYKQSANHKLAIQHDLERKRKLFNFNQSLIIIYIMFGEIIVIIAIVERTTHKVIYGSPDYDKLDSNVFYNLKGQRCLSINSPNPAYKISITDGNNFSFVKADGTVVMTFQSILTYPDLVEQSRENVLVQKFLYDPNNEVPEAIKRKSVKDPNRTPELIQQMNVLLTRLVKTHSSTCVPYHFN
jgi:hypothetical protein